MNNKNRDIVTIREFFKLIFLLKIVLNIIFNNDVNV